MRVLFLHQFDFEKGWGGSASYLVALCSTLTKMGHQVRVVSPVYPDKFGFTTCRLPFETTLTFGPEKRPGETTIDELSTEDLQRMTVAAVNAVEACEFRNGKPDLILANHINLMSLVANRLSGKHQVPYRVIAYGTDTKLLLQDQRYRDLFGPAALGADRILSISGFVADEVRATVGGRISVLGGAVNTDLFYPGEHRAAGRRRLVYFGRLVTEKGIWTLLAAFSSQKHADELELVGEGPLEKELRTHLAFSALRDRVILTGYVQQDRLRDVLLRSEIAVVPSLWQEPLGLVVLEAMACGLPVIATSVGGIPEMINDGVNGLLVPPGDAGALAAAIDRALGDPAVFQGLRDAVCKTAIPSYDDLARKAIQ